MLLAALNAIYLIVGLATLGGGQYFLKENISSREFENNYYFYLCSGSLAFSIIWPLINIAAFALVYFGLMKNNKTWLLPAMALCVFGFFLDIIWGILSFLWLNIFGYSTRS